MLTRLEEIAPVGSVKVFKQLFCTFVNYLKLVRDNKQILNVLID